MAIRTFNSPENIVQELYQGCTQVLDGDEPMKFQASQMQKSFSKLKMVLSNESLLLNRTIIHRITAHKTDP
jgi:hypothetical protein